MTAPALLVIWSPDPALDSAVIPLGERLRLGRSDGESLDLAIDDPKLSRLHAVIVRAGSGWRVEDQESANGTFVGRLRVRARDLAPGDVLRVGDTLFELGRAEQPPAHGDRELVGRSPALGALIAAVDRVAPTGSTVLVTGPIGSGKELVARRLHRMSGRKGPLVTISCGAIPPTLVEATLFGQRKGADADALSDSPGSWGEAQRGTLFLDEIGVLPPALQPKLLRALETHEYLPVGASSPMRSDVRIVSATHLNLAEEVAAGRFGRDLYTKLAEQTIVVPPLAERRVDIPDLVRHFLELLAPGRRFSLNATFLEALTVHTWPMNVRELRAAIEHAILVSGDRQQLRPTDLPVSFAMRRVEEPPPDESESDAPPRAELEAMLAQHRGNLARVAEHYGKARGQIYRWLRRHRLDPDDFRS